jgi:hypothetical protein
MHRFDLVSEVVRGMILKGKDRHSDLSAAATAINDPPCALFPPPGAAALRAFYGHGEGRMNLSPLAKCIAGDAYFPGEGGKGISVGGVIDELVAVLGSVFGRLSASTMGSIGDAFGHGLADLRVSGGFVKGVLATRRRGTWVWGRRLGAGYIRQGRAHCAVGYIGFPWLWHRRA